MQFAYDASGNRVLKRSTSGSTTTLSVYPTSGEEYDYTSTGGTLSNQLHYDSLAGHLIGTFDGTTTTYDLTDAEGSVLSSFSQSAILGEQLYGPYGNQRYAQGTIGTDKGYTGQFNDALTGLDYYNARYYDPVAGVFLSPDSVQGNAQGMDPYSYVGGNPETMTDPTGNRFVCPDCGGGGGGSDSGGSGSGGGGMPVCNSTNCNDGSGHTESNPTRHWHPVPPPVGGGGGGGTKTGAHPCVTGCAGSGKGTSQPLCNTACQISKVKNHDYAQEQKALSWLSFAADVGTLIGLGLALVVDWGDWAKEFVNLAEFIGTAVVAGADLASALGASVKGLFGTIVAGIKVVVAALDAVRGILDFIGATLNPLKGWLDKLVKFFAAQAQRQLKEGLALLIPDIADAGFYAGSGSVTQYWNDQLAADDTLTPSAAYQKCVADDSTAACS